MKKKELPKRIVKDIKNPSMAYMEELSALVEKTDGNNICLIYDMVAEYFSRYNVSEKQQTLNTLIRLYCEFDYRNVKKVLQYCESNYEIAKQEEDAFKSCTGMDLCFENMLFLLLRINTGRKKLSPHELKNPFRPYLSSKYPKVPYNAYKKINQAILIKEMDRKNFKEVTKKLTEKYHFEDFFENEKYFSVVPQSEEELVKEGNNMHNCLVMRHKTVADNNMHIVFLQKEKNVSYIDVIMDSNDKIIWCIRDFHKNVEDEKDKKLVFHWYKNFVRNVSEYSEMFSEKVIRVY